VFCHRSEVEGYARSAMAHSLRRSGAEANGTVTTPDTKITSHSSSNGYWQSLESGGQVTNYRIDYVIGSGNHASGYLLDLANHLFQSPIAYYKSRQAYDLAPGYEGLANPDFTRPVGEGCLFCHSGNALHVAGTSNEYRSPPFSAEAITCERCHGPVARHLADPRAGTIINPAKLEPAARDSICEQCHLLGVGRVLNPGKKFFDFRPGEPLEEVFTTYRVAPPGASAGKFKVISHVEQFARSTCARMSNGRMWCGTCHDPHDKPLEPVQYYRAKCLTCHTGSFSAPHPSRDSNCIGCHMPRRNAKDGGHTAFTDHRIERRPTPDSDLPADVDIAAWREPAPEFQKRNLGIAYVNVGGERRSPQFVVHGYKLLTEVQNQFASDDATFTAMGTALLLGKQSSEAELAFDRALQLNPNSATGETNAASAYLQAGDVNQAIAHLRRAVELDPLDLAADAPLIGLYRQQGNSAAAAKLSGNLSAAISHQSEESGRGASNAPSTTAEKTYKNIQVLKGVRSDQLLPAMRFITQSLGVECSYCHVPDHFDDDSKKTKQTARAMMRMMLAINNNSFDGNRGVTCYSCHRGSPKPASIPAIGQEFPTEAVVKTGEDEKLPFSLPTADQLIENYIRALGGVAAIGQISSRHESGTVTIEGTKSHIEIGAESPDKYAVVVHLTAGESVTVMNGVTGWTVAPGHEIRALATADLKSTKLDADLHLPLHLHQIFDELRVAYPETVAGHDAYVLVGAKSGQPPVKFYFDEQSRLLTRMVRLAESPLGRASTQIDYSDYRVVDGVEVPFRLTIAQPGQTSIIQIEKVEQNVAIDSTTFERPER